MTSQGILVFAFNNSQIDYISQAINLATRAKKFLNLPVSVVTDSLVDSDVFEHVIHYKPSFTTSNPYYDGALSNKNLKLSKLQMREKALKYLNEVKLEDYQNYYPHQLSGGMKQRVALARTLVSPKDIFLLDDPVSQMDTDTASAVLEGVKRLKGDATLVIISHRIAALTFCDTIFVLNKGKIGNQGSHHTLMETNPFYKNSYTAQMFEERDDTADRL